VIAATEHRMFPTQSRVPPVSAMRTIPQYRSIGLNARSASWLMNHEQRTCRPRRIKILSLSAATIVGAG